jgi:SAM-dependent MidA family methyltransferase
MKKNPFGKKETFITAPNITRLFSEDNRDMGSDLLEKYWITKKFNLLRARVLEMVR